MRTCACIIIVYILSAYYRSIQVGTFPHLKNFRKGLRHQLVKCESQLSAATASQNWQGEEEARHRLAWIYEKHLVPIDLLCCQKAPGVVGCSVGSCNSTHAWPSSNTRGWNSIYASSTPSGCDSSHSWSWISRGRCCQPSTGCNSSKRRCSEEVERHARGGSHDQVEGEACHHSTG